MSDSLLQQLIHRAKAFKERTGLTSKQIGVLLGLSEQHVCDLLAFRKGISAETTMKLLRMLNSNRKELDMKLGKLPVTSMVQHFQSFEPKTTMKMDVDSWVPKEDSTDDPNATDTDDDPDPDDTDTDDPSTEFLRDQIATHQKAISIIQSYIDKQAAAIPKARPNAGPTSGPKTIVDSRSVGPQPPVVYALPPVDKNRLLKILEDERATLEARLATEQKIKDSRAASDKLRKEFAVLTRK